MGTDRWSYGGKRFFGCPCRRHSPLRGRKVVRVVHSPINDQARAQSREVFIACPQKGVSANPVRIQAWHSDGVRSLSSLPFEIIVETNFQYAATDFFLYSPKTGSWGSSELSGGLCQSSSSSGEARLEPRGTALTSALCSVTRITPCGLGKAVRSTWSEFKPPAQLQVGTGPGNSQCCRRCASCHKSLTSNSVTGTQSL